MKITVIVCLNCKLGDFIGRINKIISSHYDEDFYLAKEVVVDVNILSDKCFLTFLSGMQ